MITEAMMVLRLTACYKNNAFIIKALRVDDFPRWYYMLPKTKKPAMGKYPSLAVNSFQFSEKSGQLHSFLDPNHIFF